MPVDSDGNLRMDMGDAATHAGLTLDEVLPVVRTSVPGFTNGLHRYWVDGPACEMVVLPETVQVLGSGGCRWIIEATSSNCGEPPCLGEWRDCGAPAAARSADDAGGWATRAARRRDDNLRAAFGG